MQRINTKESGYIQMEQNRTNIMIAGKSYQLAGQESGEYLSRLAEYIEGKYQEFSQEVSFRSQSVDKQQLLLQINIADDYFKSKEQISAYVRQCAEKDAEIRELEQKIADMKTRYDTVQNEMKKLQGAYQQMKGQLAQYERGNELRRQGNPVSQNRNQQENDGKQTEA